MNTLDAASDLSGTNRLLYGNSYGGFGNGNLAAGNSVLAASAHADGTALSAKTDCNAIRFSDGLNSLSSSFENQTRANQIDSINKNITDAEFRGSDRATGAEFRSLDRQRDIEALLVANAKEAAACCCDAKLLAAQNACDTQKLVTAEATSTRQLILEVESRSNVAALAVAQARINQLETINALK